MSKSRRNNTLRRREKKKTLRALQALGLTRPCRWCSGEPQPLRFNAMRKRARCGYCGGSGLEAKDD